MFTSQTRGERRHQSDENQHHRDRRHQSPSPSSPSTTAAARRASWQQFGRASPTAHQDQYRDQYQQQQQQQQQRLSPRPSYYRAQRGGLEYEQEQTGEPLLQMGDGDDDVVSDHDDWRQAAQMLSEQDESRLLAGHTDHLRLRSADDNYHQQQHHRQRQNEDQRRPRFGRDTTDAAPTNRRHQQQQQRPLSPPHQRSATQSPTTSQQQQQQYRSGTPPNRSKSPTTSRGAGQSNVLFTSHKMQGSKPLFTTTTTTQAGARSNHDRASESRRAGGEPLEFGRHQDDEEQDDYDSELINDHDDDDQSSISLAQSGCHSILSAWRAKAASKRRRQQQLQRRPTSVLSNSSSVGKKSSASTAYTLASRLTAGAKSHSGQQQQQAAHGGRIPLGPKSAQHFVTNTRRRRRANELILSTLEARRRAISLNRQNLLGLIDGGGGGSLFGSDIYLLGAGGELDQAGQQDLLRATPDDYQRLSLSPSPGGVHPLQLGGAKSPSPLPLSKRALRSPSGALSDLGATPARQSPATARLHQAALVKQQHRPKSLSQSSLGAKKPASSSGGSSGRPPLAKLDQNSSDLCSSNESSSGESSPSSASGDSSGSHFTQLVTSELVSNCAELLDKHALKLNRADSAQSPHRYSRRLTSPAPPAPAPRLPLRDESIPRPASRSQAGAPLKSQPKQQQRENYQDLIIRQEARSRASPDRRNQPEVTTRARSSPSAGRTSVLSDHYDDDDNNLADDETPTTTTSKLRRGTDLKRDSVRRLRMKQSTATTTNTKRPTNSSKASKHREHPSESASSSSDQQAGSGGSSEPQPVIALTGAKSPVKIQPLSKSRRLEIENNPFLKRNQFRTMSLRSAIEQTDGGGDASPLTRPGAGSRPQDHDKHHQRRSTRSTTSRRGPTPDPDESAGVRQVEQMLRQMKPNQVLRSRSRENITASGSIAESVSSPLMRSKSSEQGADSRLRSSGGGSANFDHQRLQVANPLGTSPAPAPPPKPQRLLSPISRPPLPTRHSRQEEEEQRSQRSQAGAHDKRLNEFKTTTRLVREGAKSSDDLAFDLHGNRRQLAVQKSWRHEQTVEQPAATTSRLTSRTTTMTSQQQEVRKQATTMHWPEQGRQQQEQQMDRRPVSISPPAEFSDNNVSSSSSPPRRYEPHYKPQLQSYSYQQSQRDDSTKRSSIEAAPKFTTMSAASRQPIVSRPTSTTSRSPGPAPTPPPRPLPADRSLGPPSSLASRGKQQERSLSPPTRQSSSGKPPIPSRTVLASKSAPRPLSASKSEETHRHSLPASSVSRDTRLSLLDRAAAADGRSRDRSLNERQSDTPKTAASRREPSLDALHVVQVASLPKFERTADDEFRKRVDQLRQLARANLNDAYQQEQRQGRRQLTSTSSSASSSATRPSTRPLSLNWDGNRSSGTGSAPRSVDDATHRLSLLKSIDESAPLESHQEATSTSAGHISEVPRARSVPRSEAASSSGSGATASQFAARREPIACTNLDDMLLADRYQRPMPTSSWGRSNSSLASLGSSRPGQHQEHRQERSQQTRIQPRRPMSPPSFGSGRDQQHAQVASSSKAGSVLSELSAISSGPRPPTNVSELVPMRLVVKEKSAPTRNFAFVEQRPSVQQLQSRRSPSPAPPPPTPRPVPDVSTSLPKRPLTGSTQSRALSPASLPPASQRPTASKKETSTSHATSETTAVQRATTTTASGKPAPIEPDVARQTGPQATRQLAPRTRLPSPRSPELGQATNSSTSNDDSAIASSVSSPSLSYTMASGNGNNSAGPVSQSASDQKPFSSSANVRMESQSSGLRVAPLFGLRAPLAPVASTSGASQQQVSSSSPSSGGTAPAARPQSSGVLQSILRRQQMRQQAQFLERPLDSSDSEPPRPANGQSAQQLPVSSSSNISTTTTQTTRTTLTETTATTSTSRHLGQQQQQLETGTIESSSAGSNGAANQQSQEQPMIAQQEPLAQTKRVHFNDRTSVRSFESISSDHSQTTAIDRDQLDGSEASLGQQEHQRQQNQRLLIGSPDSVGSGSTSRLSCDSPDFRRSSSGAAIYAIRGDPELENQSASASMATPARQLNAQPQTRVMLVGAPNSGQMFHSGNNGLLGPAQQHHQRHIVAPPQAPLFHRQQALGAPSGVSDLTAPPQQQQHPVSVSIAQQQFNQRQQQRQLQQQLGGSSPSVASIRMTAPPAIGSGGQSLQQVQPARIQAQPYAPRPVQPNQQHQFVMSAAPVAHHQGLVGMRPPLPPTQQQLSARPMVSAPSGQQQQRPVSLEDEDDPDYALRLRQAASNRVFSFVQQQQQQQHPQQQQLPSPSLMNGSGRGGGGGGGSQVQRRQPIDMSNFQTEV